jgi:hypothetical protein
VRVDRSVTLAASAEDAFSMVDDLGRYPQWMDLVYDVAELAPTAAGPRVWAVELRAQVGPFARSKRLRMARTLHDPPQRVVFERSEVDGRHHSVWLLESTVEPTSDASVRLTMTLTYGGNLWAGAVLERVLDDHVERGAAALAAQLAVTDHR